MYSNKVSEKLPSINLRYFQFVILFIICLCFISLISRLYMTERIPFIMDELVDTQIACQMAKGSNLYSDYFWPRTPLMNFLIGVYVGSGNDSFYTAVSARKLMWFGTVLIFILVYLITRRLHSYKIAIFSVLLLCSYTTFLDHSICIRADAVSTLLSLPALLVLVSPNLSTILMGVAGFFLGLSFLTTQKALYFIIAFAVAFIGRETLIRGINIQSLNTIVLKGIYSTLGFLLPISYFIIWLYLTNQLAPFFKSGLINAAHSGLINDTYKESTKIFLGLTIIRNPAFWFLGIWGLILHMLWGIRKKYDNSTQIDIQRSGSFVALSLWTFILLVLVLNHNIKFPYVFLNVAPCLAVCATLPLYYLFKTTQLKKNNKSLYFLNLIFMSILFYYIIIPPVLRHYNNLYPKNLTRIQKAVMDRVDSITKPDDAVLDGVGMAVTRKVAIPYSLTARWYNERKAGAHYDIISYVIASQPKILIKNYRFKLLSRDEQVFLNNHFLWDWANVFVVGVSILHDGSGVTEKKFNLLASCEYGVLAEDRGDIEIDGNIPGRWIYLTAGEHEIIIKGERQTVQLKYLPALKKPLPLMKPFELFPSYQD
jgi:hypothetical protein